MWDGKLLKIHRARAMAEFAAQPPGTIVAAAQSLDVATGTGILVIDELQLEGRKRMTAADFSRGAAPRAGARLGQGASQAGA
jgi:methionyl-tRNA formyltransferase